MRDTDRILTFIGVATLAAGAWQLGAGEGQQRLLGIAIGSFCILVSEWRLRSRRR